MIMQQHLIDGVHVLKLRKHQTCEPGSAVGREMVPLLLDSDADVFDFDTGNLLARFRTKVLSTANLDLFYHSVRTFARGQSKFRSTSGKHVTEPVRSNIFGYYDRWCPNHYAKLRLLRKKPRLNIRECAFNLADPTRFQSTWPLLHEINAQFKELLPGEYTAQNNEADGTIFRIGQTAFSTVTINLNFQTRVHVDSGDCLVGFGNLIVIERGAPYTGGETAFPEYGVGFDVRSGSILFMDVHVPHANLPIVFAGEKGVRLSVVCYLRNRIVSQSKQVSKAQQQRHAQFLTRTFGAQK